MKIKMVKIMQIKNSVMKMLMAASPAVKIHLKKETQKRQIIR
jgi:hypothetical protein